MQNSTEPNPENPNSPENPFLPEPSTPVPSPGAFVSVESSNSEDKTSSSSTSGTGGPKTGFRLFTPEEDGTSPPSPSPSTSTRSEESDEEITSSQQETSSQPSSTAPPSPSTDASPSTSTSAESHGGSRGESERSASIPDPANRCENEDLQYDIDVTRILDYCRTLLTCEAGGDAETAWEWLDQTCQDIQADPLFRAECKNLLTPLEETKPIPLRRIQTLRHRETTMRITPEEGLEPLKKKRKKQNSALQDDKQPSTSSTSSTKSCAARRTVKPITRY